jgi:phosphate transport system substrate-binding protein
MIRSSALFLGSVLLMLVFSQTAVCDLAKVEIDPSLPSYEKQPGISGNLNSIGSDTLNNQLTLWAEAFRAIYPAVNIQIEGKGSATAPPALIEGTAQIGPMSRQMKQEEVDAFVARFGYPPTEIRVAIDALAIYVHKDNPLPHITLEQIDGAFSATLRRGGQPVNTWGDLGLEGDWARRPISLLGRNSASGTYGFFKDVALANGDFKSTVKEQPGSSSVVQAVGSDLYALGYSGIGYISPNVRAVPILQEGEAVKPGYEECLDGRYPLARFLIIYTNIHPERGPDPLTREFILFILSKEGQTIVRNLGYYPLPRVVVEQERQNLGITANESR